MSLEACVALVRRADPDRAAAAELASVDVQKVLWPLYAMNVEVSRAPWVTQEPMIAEMRLQWWRDALEEIAEGRAVRSHEVTTPLAEAIGPEEARLLDKLVAARRWDIYSDAFEDEAALLRYLDDTAAGLMVVAASAIDAPNPDALKAYGRAVGLARFLQAAPELDARGRKPLLDGTPAGIKTLCEKVLSDMPAKPEPRDVTREGWQARALLRLAIAQPTRVADGTLVLSEFSKRWRLLLF
ncbi:squalene/phytoene synthase [Litoreibacter ponti]|uniref:Squalene/phytoene synthase n=1 Tax=Litoreibacter ponti TaxID=1510457 RepID=A0A2T6BJ41_9RHOB|nr:squalene/phytoene synthase family protein [Litoreibacter ponti]PTX56078.1 squalene/phytoene synthase [Litoreibacter ponti]